MTRRAGRHFLQIPGPTNVPDRVLRAIDFPTMDHRGPEFGALGLRVLKGIQQVFQTKHPVAIYPASGTGAWNTSCASYVRGMAARKPRSVRTSMLPSTAR